MYAEMKYWIETEQCRFGTFPIALLVAFVQLNADKFFCLNLLSRFNLN
jgi:hypothetical protein